MGRKDKGRKGENGKGKGRKRDRARSDAIAAEAAMSIATTSNPVAAVEAAPKLDVAPKAQGRPTAPKTRVATPKFADPRTAAPRAPARGVAAPKVEREPLPADRVSLLVLHKAARRRRDAAPLLSAERAEASFEIERIEVHVARVERAMDPPLV